MNQWSHVDYYLPMLSPNEGYNETGLTMQSAGPVREPWQPTGTGLAVQQSPLPRNLMDTS